MTKRERILHAIRAAAYHGDMAEATRLYIENRISWTALKRAVEIGRRQREAGLFQSSTPNT